MLHTVNKSPFEKNSLSTCVSLVDDKGVILLIEDGVIGAAEHTKSSVISDLAAQGRVYALAEDLTARGLINKVSKGINVVDYKGFVELVVEHGANASWL